MYYFLNRSISRFKPKSNIDIGQTNTEMQTALQACATVDGVNLGAATVTLKALDSDLS